MRSSGDSVASWMGFDTSALLKVLEKCVPNVM